MINHCPGAHSTIRHMGDKHVNKQMVVLMRWRDGEVVEMWWRGGGKVVERWRGGEVERWRVD